MHWTAGFRLCYILAATGPPPVMSIVKTMRVAFRILGGIVCLAILTNLISWMVLSGIHGGTAWNGKVKEGRYYVGSHSRYTEVSPSQYRFSRFQETSNSIILAILVPGRLLYVYYTKRTLRS
jgi:hypothetical protein